MASGPGVAREARLAFIVDGKGARHEARLTADEMRALVNGGKEAAEVLKKAIPPSIVPPKVVPEIKALTGAINRMREASRQATADAFGARLAIEMERAEQAAMRLQRGLDGVTAARRRMQQAAGLAAGTAHASRIGALDPFQTGAAFEGPQLGPALPAHMKSSGAAADRAAISVNKLQQGMTSLAIASGALPGPLGRVGSTLGTFALGSPLMVGVLAGIAAIGFAWEKFTEDARRAKDMMRELEGMQASFQPAARAARIQGLEGEESSLKTALERAQSTGGGILGIDKDLVLISRLSRQLDHVRDQLGTLRTAEASASRGEQREKSEQAAQRAAEAQRDLLRLSKDVMRSNADRVRLAKQEYELAGLTGLAAEKQRIEFAAQNAEIEARRTLSGDLLDAQLRAITNEKVWKNAAAERADMYERAAKAAEKEAAQRKAALQHLASFAIDTVAGAAGPFGGAISGVATNAMQGNMWGAAAAGITGVVSGILGIGSASKAAREALRQAQLQFDDFNNTVKVTLGLMSPLEYRLSGLRRSFEDSRQAVGATDEQIKRLEKSLLTAGDPKVIEALQREIDRRKALNAESAALEAAITALEEARAAKDVEFATKDLEVRQLLAMGRDEEAEAMALLIKQEREMEQARRDGKGAIYELELAETHRLERVRIEMDKVQARIESLTSTITGLEGFRDTLKLDQTVSPTDRLTEARRQYEAVMEAARSDDSKTSEEAAGRLPQAANALLDALRVMFGSSPDFQAERQRIIGDTDELINQFKNRKAVEELMLEELRKIATHTDPDRIVNHGPVGSLPPALPPGSGGGGGGGGGVGDGSSGGGTTAAVVAASGTAIVAELRSLGQRIDDNERRMRDSLNAVLSRL